MSRLSAAMLALVWQLAGLAAPTSGTANWPRLYVSDPGTRLIVERALDRAALRLAEPTCQSIFSIFRDRKGRPLSDRLAEHGTTPVEYLRLIAFFDGGHQARCGAEVAYTQPGSRVVYICARQFEGSWWRHPEHAEAAIIHEALHTLGLGENPPSSAEITNRVRRHCGSRALSGSKR